MEVGASSPLLNGLRNWLVVATPTLGRQALAPFGGYCIGILFPSQACFEILWILHSPGNELDRRGVAQPRPFTRPRSPLLFSARRRQPDFWHLGC